jgi:hypothetical protein
MRYRARLRKLEAIQWQREPAHFVSVVKVPRTVLHPCWHEWVRTHVCCPELRVGLPIAEPCQTAEEWAAWVQAEHVKTEAARLPEQEAWWSMHGGLASEP